MPAAGAAAVSRRPAEGASLCGSSLCGPQAVAPGCGHCELWVMGCWHCAVDAGLSFRVAGSGLWVPGRPSRRARRDPFAWTCTTCQGSHLRRNRGGHRARHSAGPRPKITLILHRHSAGATHACIPPGTMIGTLSGAGRPSGGIGRRAGFKIPFLRKCRFDSGGGHHYSGAIADRLLERGVLCCGFSLRPL